MLLPIPEGAADQEHEPVTRCGGPVAIVPYYAPREESVQANSVNYHEDREGDMQPLVHADRRERTRRSMDLPLRYLHWAPDHAAPFTEAAFGHREKWVALEPRAVALVLLDVWNIGWGPAPLIVDIPLTGATVRKQP